MRKGIYLITKKDLLDLFSRLAEGHRVFVPYDYKGKYVLAGFDPAKENSIQLGGIRQAQPLKSFINPARENITAAGEKDRKRVIVAGVKQCDLNSLILQDYVFLKSGAESDPFYAFHRENTFIISSDCTCPKETCFCIAMGGKPYPEKEFNVNLTPSGEFFIAEIATDKAADLLDRYKTFFKEARARERGERDKIRSEACLAIEDFIKQRATPDKAAIKGAVKRQYDNLDMWKDFASACVECGACNFACPTCHCFLLYDEKNARQNFRGRVWDACLYKTFARVAGGANPRKHLFERLRNRFDKKFEFFPQVLDYTACTGCGRCIEACPGNIDIREVLKGVVSGNWKKPPHD